MLSTTSFAPLRCVTSAMAAMSNTVSSGLVGVSIHTIFVAGFQFASSAAGSVRSAADQVMPARVTTWLYRVAVNAAHDRRRRRATYVKASEGWGDWEVNRVAANEDTSRAIDWLTMAMGQLTDDLRDTLALVLDDMTHAQAADILGVSESTISWRISEAKKRLREIKQMEDAG